MGKNLLILMLGFAASFGILASGKGRRYVDSVDRMVQHFSGYSAGNASTSGAYMALNRLFQSPTWRTGYSNLVLAGDTISVAVEDNTVDSTLGSHFLRVRSVGRNANVTDQTQVLIFDAEFGEFAIWAKDTVINVTAKDPLGIPDDDLLIMNAPFMPKIDYDGLVNQAATQSHVQTAAEWEPGDNYPNGSFYYSGLVPNVTRVTGNLRVRGGRTVYGIFIVEGNAVLDGNARVQGVLYLPNPTSTVIHGGGSPDESSITGGILTWGTIDGTGNHISARLKPEYMSAFVEGFAPENPPISVVSWQ